MEIQKLEKVDKKTCNSSNHHEKGMLPDDYKEVIEKTYTYHWIDNFKEYKKITIDMVKNSFLRRAGNMYKIKGCVEFPSCYINELEALTKEINIPDIHKYFVRSDSCSLKCSGKMRFESVKDLLEHLVYSYSNPSHSPLSESDKVLNLYLIPYVEINKDLEFRVFIYKGKITAISQQFWYQENKSLNDKNIKDYGERIIKYFENIKEKIKLDSFVMDMAFVKNKEYFIEINPFGKEYGSGSALFHWINDEDILYGKSDKIVLRYY